MSGPVDTAGGRLTTSALASTEMGCDAPLMEQDAWFGDLLAAAPVWKLDGDTLTVTSGDTTITLADRRVADPDRPLEGTTWRLDGLIDGDAVASVPQGVVRDDDDQGRPWCRSPPAATTIVGQGSFDGTSVRVTAMSAHRCRLRRRQADVENAMSVVLRDFTYRISAGALTATGTDGKGLTFIAVDRARDAGDGASDPDPQVDAHPVEIRCRRNPLRRPQTRWPAAPSS